MDKQTLVVLQQQFDVILQTTEEEGVEFWYAHDLMPLLGYSRWENFETAIKRALTSCETTGIPYSRHFREVTKTSPMPNGGTKDIKDYAMTRYACYLVAQNGDPRKPEIAFAQGYFAVQTRRQELIEERVRYIERMEARDCLRESEKRLSQNIYERGVDDAGFGRIRSKGDKALFGGYRYRWNEKALRCQRKTTTC